MDKESTKKKLNDLFFGNSVKVDSQKKTASTKPNFYSNGPNNFPNNQENIIYGLKNLGNSCYSNVVLQSIFSCGGFLINLKKLLYYIENNFGQSAIDVDYPIIYNLSYALQYYEEKNLFACSQHLKCLCLIFDPFGKQNDAHEFFYFLMNKLNEESVKLDSINKNELNQIQIKKELSPSNMNDDYNWQEVKKDGKRMKLTNKIENFTTSLTISNLFGGVIRQETCKKGLSLSNSKVEPFYSIIINPDKLCLVKCLDDYFSKKRIVGNENTSNKTYLEKLPNIFVIQVKSFYYDKNTKSVNKDSRPINFNTFFNVRNDWLSPCSQSSKTNGYTLSSIIVHQGKFTHEGHYICYCSSSCNSLEKNSSWYYINDNKTISVKEEDVLKIRPYLLFYKLVNE